MIKKIRSHHDFMWGYLMDLLKTLTRPATIFLLFLSSSFIVISALGVLFFEQGANTKITTFFDAFYYIITIFTGVGLGDIYAITTGGRIISMFIMLIGTSLYVCLVTVIASTVIAIESRPKK